MSTPIPALVFAALTLVACLFQLALAAGMPWGHLAMGGKFPGRFPPAIRGVAVFQAALLVGLAVIVLARAELVLPQLRPAAGWLIWSVVIFSAVGSLANLATPSKWERILWAPVTLLMLGCSLWVALH